ncbi:hypothetical protein [Paludisphaera sp.]|uniref:hypothetical protein n=1 Tax=Paludisphaera sp. TaxID=2017432 RepID=UPI00301DD981
MAHARFSARAGQRIKTAVQRIEGLPVADASGRASARPAYNPGNQRARVTVAIPSGTWDVPSSTGKVRLRFKDTAGAWVDGPEVQCFNDMTMPAPLPVNRVVKVSWIAGDYWLVSASCS